MFTPKLVEAIKHVKIVQVASSRDNTYFLTSDGALYGCGTNQFKQLGQTPTTKLLTPKPINLGKRFKNKTIKHIECSKFHVNRLFD